MERLLLVNPSSAVYATSRIKAGITYVPQVSLAILGAVAEAGGHQVRILDLNVADEPHREFEETVRAFAPTVVGITLMTPNYGAACELVARSRALCPGALLVAGGAHPSVLPEDTVSEGGFDVAVKGEGEETLAEILMHLDDLAGVRGIAYRTRDGSVQRNGDRDLIGDLDRIPLPAWHLFDLSRYPTSKLTSRASPVGSICTSRGCPHACIYCAKDVFGRIVRYKSPERVLREITHARRAGFRELHVWDDHFATHRERAKTICRAVIDEGLRMPLSMFGGLRVDSVDEELMFLLKGAGCYQVALAPETGSDALLERINKGISLDQCRSAFASAHKAGLETIAYFMLALPGETEETAEATIRFAIELDPDYAKVTYATPLPGTPLFHELERDGCLKTRDWSKYAFHDTKEVYNHPTMSWDDLERCYKAFYRRFYWRPRYVARRLGRGLLNGTLISDSCYALRTWLGRG